MHIVAHSMGGLDARYMIVNLGMAEKVASLTTIGTPHLGTSLADWCMAHQGHEVVRLLRDIIDLGGFADLTIGACRRFNEVAKAAEATNEVVYQAYASSEQRELVFAPLQVCWDIIHQAEGSNDGLVSRDSQRWVARLAKPDGTGKIVSQHDFPVSADHFNEVGWWDINQLRNVNLLKTSLFTAIKSYETSVRNVYLEIAMGLRQLP